MNKPILNTIQKAGIDGFDCASIYEYCQAKKTKCNNFALVGNGFDKNDIKKIDFETVKFDCSNISQLNYILMLHPNVKIGVRIKCTSNLGISMDELKHINYLKNITRIHFHGESIKNINQVLNELVEYLNTEKINNINLGGGMLALKILSYMDEEVKDLIKNIKKKFPNASITIEPGQLLTSSVGFLVTKVIGKSNGDLILNNSAFNLSSWYTPKLLYPHLEKGNNKILGDTNWNEDIFVKNITTNDINVGEKIYFGFVGAYYSTTQRNLHGYSFPKETYFTGDN